MSNTIGTSRGFRIDGPTISLSDLAKKHPERFIKMTDEQVAEVKFHDEQVRGREQISREYAANHPDKVYAQVLVDGKVFATVFESGVAQTPYPMDLPNEGYGAELADKRLEAIAKAGNGTISFTNRGGRIDSQRSIPEALLTPVTARGLVDFVDAMRWQVERARIDVAEK